MIERSPKAREIMANTRQLLNTGAIKISVMPLLQSVWEFVKPASTTIFRAKKI